MTTAYTARARRVIGRIEGVLDERSKERRQEEDPREFYAVARLGEALIDRMIG
jgi:hypothetical protein